MPRTRTVALLFAAAGSSLLASPTPGALPSPVLGAAAQGSQADRYAASRQLAEVLVVDADEIRDRIQAAVAPRFSDPHVEVELLGGDQVKVLCRVNVEELDYPGIQASLKALARTINQEVLGKHYTHMSLAPSSALVVSNRRSGPMGGPAHPRDAGPPRLAAMRKGPASRRPAIPQRQQILPAQAYLGARPTEVERPPLFAQAQAAGAQLQALSKLRAALDRGPIAGPLPGPAPSPASASNLDGATPTRRLPSVEGASQPSRQPSIDDASATGARPGPPPVALAQGPRPATEELDASGATLPGSGGVVVQDAPAPTEGRQPGAEPLPMARPVPQAQPEPRPDVHFMMGPRIARLGVEERRNPPPSLPAVERAAYAEGFAVNAPLPLPPPVHGGPRGADAPFSAAAYAPPRFGGPGLDLAELAAPPGRIDLPAERAASRPQAATPRAQPAASGSPPAASRPQPPLGAPPPRQATPRQGPSPRAAATRPARRSPPPLEVARARPTPASRAPAPAHRLLRRPPPVPPRRPTPDPDGFDAADFEGLPELELSPFEEEMARAEEDRGFSVADFDEPAPRRRTTPGRRQAALRLEELRAWLDGAGWPRAQVQGTRGPGLRNQWTIEVDATDDPLPAGAARRALTSLAISLGRILGPEEVGPGSRVRMRTVDGGRVAVFEESLLGI